jgi:hypothetical protein
MIVITSPRLLTLMTFTPVLIDLVYLGVVAQGV